MTDDNENLKALKAAYWVWHESGGQDASKWFALAAEDMAIFSIAQGAAPAMEFSAPAVGRAGLAMYIETLQRDWQLLAMHPEEFVVDGDGDRIVMIGAVEVCCRRTGKTARSPIIHYWRFRDGKAVDFREYYDTAGAMAAATPDNANGTCPSS